MRPHGFSPRSSSIVPLAGSLAAGAGMRMSSLQFVVVVFACLMSFIAGPYCAVDCTHFGLCAKFSDFHVVDLICRVPMTRICGSRQFASQRSFRGIEVGFLWYLFRCTGTLVGSSHRVSACMYHDGHARAFPLLCMYYRLSDVLQCYTYSTSASMWLKHEGCRVLVYKVCELFFLGPLYICMSRHVVVYRSFCFVACEAHSCVVSRSLGWSFRWPCRDPPGTWCLMLTFLVPRLHPVVHTMEGGPAASVAYPHGAALAALAIAALYSRRFANILGCQSAAVLLVCLSLQRLSPVPLLLLSHRPIPDRLRPHRLIQQPLVRLLPHRLAPRMCIRFTRCYITSWSASLWSPHMAPFSSPAVCAGTMSIARHALYRDPHLLRRGVWGGHAISLGFIAEAAHSTHLLELWLAPPRRCWTCR